MSSRGSAGMKRPRPAEKKAEGHTADGRPSKVGRRADGRAGSSKSPARGAGAKRGAARPGTRGAVAPRLRGDVEISSDEEGRSDDEISEEEEGPREVEETADQMRVRVARDLVNKYKKEAAAELTDDEDGDIGDRMKQVVGQRLLEASVQQNQGTIIFPVAKRLAGWFKAGHVASAFHKGHHVSRAWVCSAL
jgi:hypothetical protein